MIEEIKRRLDAGEVVELECVDRIGFLKDIYRSEANEKILDQGELIVDYIYHDGDIMLVGGIGDIYRNVIVGGEFKYFRIKESSATFDDLIAVAVQAYKDGVLSKVELRDDEINLTKLGVISSDRGSSVFQDAISDINSLYTETFVIESEEDINKVLSRKEIGFNRKSMSVATLMNGNEILITRLDPDNTDGIVVYMRDGLYKNYLGIDVLKGATVTQKRGGL